MEPVCRKPFCRILELKKNKKTNNVGMLQVIKRASVMSTFPLLPAALGDANVPIFLSEVEQEQKCNWELVFATMRASVHTPRMATHYFVLTQRP